MEYKDRLSAYAERLRKNIKTLEQRIDDLNDELVMHDRFRITDAGGEERIREDLHQTGAYLDRDHKYLKAVMAKIDAES